MALATSEAWYAREKMSSPRFRWDLGPQQLYCKFRIPGSALHCQLLLTIHQLIHQADFTIPVEIEGAYHNVYVIKRPGVDQFMKRVGELYELVIFTASVSKVSAWLSSVNQMTDLGDIVWGSPSWPIGYQSGGSPQVISWKLFQSSGQLCKGICSWPGYFNLPINICAIFRISLS